MCELSMARPEFDQPELGPKMGAQGLDFDDALIIPHGLWPRSRSWDVSRYQIGSGTSESASAMIGAGKTEHRPNPLSGNIPEDPSPQRPSAHATCSRRLRRGQVARLALRRCGPNHIVFDLFVELSFTSPRSELLRGSSRDVWPTRASLCRGVSDVGSPQPLQQSRLWHGHVAVFRPTRSPSLRMSPCGCAAMRGTRAARHFRGAGLGAGAQRTGFAPPARQVTTRTDVSPTILNLIWAKTGPNKVRRRAQQMPAQVPRPRPRREAHSGSLWLWAEVTPLTRPVDPALQAKLPFSPPPPPARFRRNDTQAGLRWRVALPGVWRHRARIPWRRSGDFPRDRVRVFAPRGGDGSNFDRSDLVPGLGDAHFDR